MNLIHFIYDFLLNSKHILSELTGDKCEWSHFKLQLSELFISIKVKCCHILYFIFFMKHTACLWVFIN